MKESSLMARMTLVASLTVVSGLAQRVPVTGVYYVPLNEPDLIDYTVGDRSFVLSLQQAARVPASFHARFIWGDKNHILSNAKTRLDGDKCVTFNAPVLRVRAGAAIVFVNRPNASWLGPFSQPQIYTVVFEAGDDTSEWIRLPFDDLDKYYLRNAKQIRINPSSIAALNNPPVGDVGRRQSPWPPALPPSDIPCTPVRESRVRNTIHRPGA